jgi:hypothetical protein
MGRAWWALGGHDGRTACAPSGHKTAPRTSIVGTLRAAPCAHAPRRRMGLRRARPHARTPHADAWACGARGPLRARPTQTHGARGNLRARPTQTHGARGTLRASPTQTHGHAARPPMAVPHSCAWGRACCMLGGPVGTYGGGMGLFQQPP